MIIDTVYAYYRNGQLEMEGNHKEGKLIYERWWDETGQLRKEWTFKEGYSQYNIDSRTGQKCWDKDGKKIKCEDLRW